MTAQWLNFNRLCSFLRPRDLGQEGTCDEDLNQGGDDQLGHKQEDGVGTLLCDETKSIANGRLGLQGEEECPSQGVHVLHARLPLWGELVHFQVPVKESDGVVDHPKEEPGHDESSSKQGEFVPPLHVYDCSPQILQVEQVNAIDFVNPHVAVAALGHHAGFVRLEHGGVDASVDQGHTGHVDLRGFHPHCFSPEERRKEGCYLRKPELTLRSI